MNERAKKIAEKMKERQDTPPDPAAAAQVHHSAGPSRPETPRKAPSRPAKASKPFIPFRYPPETTIHLRWDGTQWIALMTVLTGDTRETLQLNGKAVHDTLRGLAKLYGELTAKGE